MGKAPHILIIGAGLIGLSTADSLMARGAKVTLIEARSGPGQGASFANSGMIHPSQARPWGFRGFDRAADDAVFRSVYDLAKYSAQLIRSRMADLGLAARSRPAGCYKLYESFETAQRAQAIYIGDEIKSDIIVDPAKTLGHPALFFPNDYSGNAYEYCRALAKELHDKGAVFIYEAEGLRLRQNEDGIAARLKQHVFKTNHVIIAAGSQSPDIAAQVGIRLVMTPLKGYAVNYAKPDIALPDGPFMDARSQSALTVFDDHIRLSGTINEEDDTALLARWTELAPYIMAVLSEPLSRWSGHRPMTASGRPYIGPTSVPGLWVNTGHGHMGWTLCAGSGELMAKMVLDGTVDERFALAGTD